MFKLFKNFKKTEWFLVFVSIVFIVGQVWLDLKMPDYMSKITMIIQMPNGSVQEIWVQGGYMLACALGSLAFSIVVGFCASRIASNFSANIRGEVYDKVSSFSMKEINRFSTASLITRSTNDITQVQMFVVMGLQILIKAPIMAVWAITKIGSKSYEWSFVTFWAVVILLAMITFVMAFALPRFKKMQKLTDDVNLVARENLTGVRVVRAYNAESFEEKRFENVNQALTHNQLTAMRFMTVIMPGIDFIMQGLTIAIYWVGANLINNALGNDKFVLFSDMLVFSQYAMRVIMSFMMIAMISIMLPRALVSAKRLNEVLDTKNKIVDGEIEKSADDVKGEIEFKNVSFKYHKNGDDVLQGITFKAHKGETVAFIGATGCGKTTLVTLIPRLFDVTGGEVLVDGINVKDYKQKALRNKIGFVPQRAVMFSGTVASNVAFGDNGKGEISQDEIAKAVEIAQGKDFVEKMTNKYEARVAQGGTNVSGGQKQRLAIARAIARSPEIYIFDDSFSALDYKTDRNLRTALQEATTNATTLIVSQRIGTIKNANTIIVLDEGKIVGQGTHEELMNHCDIYKEIALSQLSEEELKNV
ncbi:MAG: ABC transporter ATP-binding protein [Clostridia bacterium]